MQARRVSYTSTFGTLVPEGKGDKVRGMNPSLCLRGRSWFLGLPDPLSDALMRGRDKDQGRQDAVVAVTQLSLKILLVGRRLLATSGVTACLWQSLAMNSSWNIFAAG